MRAGIRRSRSWSPSPAPSASTVTLKSSITGLASSVSAICSAVARRRRPGRRPSSSSSKRLPWRTLVTPSKPSAAARRCTAWPWGSRISGLSMTSTTTRATGSPIRFSRGTSAPGLLGGGDPQSTGGYGWFRPHAAAGGPGGSWRRRRSRPGQPLVGLDVARPGGGHDVGGQGRRRGVARVRSQPEAGEISQSRTYCLSKDGCARPGSHWSAGQNREESGVSTSSAEDQRPRPREPAELELGVGQQDARARAAISRARA